MINDFPSLKRTICALFEFDHDFAKLRVRFQKAEKYDVKIIETPWKGGKKVRETQI